MAKKKSTKAGKKLIKKVAKKLIKKAKKVAKKKKKKIEAEIADAEVRESAIFSQPEAATAVSPGAGGIQYLTRLMGRGRALEVMLSARDYDADLAERYGWINRALPANALNDFVRSLAYRIAKFPAAGLVAIKDRVNAIALAPVEDFRRDSDLFGEGAQKLEAQRRFQAALQQGFQTRGAEMDLARMLGELRNH